MPHAKAYASKTTRMMKFMAEEFTPEEWRLAQNISHWDCLYHGAAKIMAPIGKAFAEAMVKLQRPK